MKYKNITKKLYIDEHNLDKNLNDGLASLTHLYHNQESYNSDYYKESAKNYLREHDVLKGEEPEQFYLPFEFIVQFPSPTKPKFTFIDLFAGIGGFRIALQNLNGKCVFSSEIDKSAKKTYTLNFGECPFGDIRNFTGEAISDEQLNLMIPDHDILTGGFPCQPFSLAGVSARNHLGLAHGFLVKIQGTLFYDIVRIIEVKRPEVVFLENVKNFKNHNHGDTLKTVLAVMEALNYDIHYEEINANLKVPQNRKRFYMVFFKKKNSFFKFPKYSGEPLKLKTILEQNVSDEYTISDKLWDGHKRRTKANLDRGTGFTAFVADIEKPSNTIVARYGKDGKECLIPQEGKNPRKLTKLECARLQGYPNDYVLPSSNAAAYRQFGNSVAVPVIQDIGRNILDSLEKNKIKLNGI